jgi:hypothetical protein
MSPKPEKIEDALSPGGGKVPAPEAPAPGAMVFYGRATPANLNPAVQKALGGLKVREIPGIAESWNSKDKNLQPGDFIAGICVQYRERVSQFESDVIVLETPDGFRSVWLGVDLKAKISAASIGRPMVISYEGEITRARAKGPMKNYRVLEVLIPDGDAV